MIKGNIDKLVTLSIKNTSSKFLHMSDVEKRVLADILHFRTVCVCPFKHDLVTPFYKIM